MGRNHANLIKWISYAVAFLLIFFFESCVFNRFPAFGAVPMLAPLVVTAVALFEGSLNGAFFGLAVGFFCSAVYYRSGLMMIPVFTIIGVGAGATRKQKIGRSLLGCAICGLGALALLELCHMASGLLFHGTPLSTLAQVALPELAYSMLFLIPIYLLIRTVYRRVRTDTEL